MSIRFSARRRLGPFHYEAALEADQEILVLFGHSGAGKSVTLQLIAGLMHPDEGRIEIDGRPVFDSSAGLSLPPQQRETGYVVQDLALFPHMTVAQNVAFGMIGERDERTERLQRLLGLVGLEGFEKRRPSSLSGGQAQRVALARALARDARLLLLDEPFSALDDSLRRTMRRELTRLRTELGLTILFVTHDLREAHLLADRLAVFDRGRLLQIGPRDSVFRAPESRRVADLTGAANILPGYLVDPADAPGRRARVGHLELQVGSIAPGLAGAGPGTAVDLAIRAERVVLHRGAPPEALNLIDVRVTEDLSYGSSHTLHLVHAASGTALEAEIASRPYEVLGVATRGDWLVELPPEDLHAMPGSPEAGGRNEPMRGT